jgi:hypothetical protein
MLIRLYGKPGCGLCQAAADKLDALVDAGTITGYRKLDLAEFTTLHDGWRADGSVEARAALAFIDERLPVLVIDGLPYTYPEAMRLLRGRA